MELCADVSSNPRTVVSEPCQSWCKDVDRMWQRHRRLYSSNARRSRSIPKMTSWYHCPTVDAPSATRSGRTTSSTVADVLIFVLAVPRMVIPIEVRSSAYLLLLHTFSNLGGVYVRDTSQLRAVSA